jgi:alcohol dehydrogenase class IV
MVKKIIWSGAETARVSRKAGLGSEKSEANNALDVVFRELGTARSLKEIGVSREKLDVLAENSLNNPCCVVNPIPADTL